MSLIDRYLLREWLKNLGLVLGATLGLLLMQSMYDDFSDLMQMDATAVDALAYFAVRLPAFISIVLLLSLLISVLFVLSQMHRNNEIIALRAAGVGLFRITRSLWLAGVVLCGVVWYLNASVIPWSIEESRTIWERLKFRQETQGVSIDRVGVKTSVAFDNQRENRMWFFNRYSAFTQRGYGATVVELDAQRREKTRLLAREAWRDPASGHWMFRDGREVWLEPETGEPIRTVPFAEKAVPYYREDPALMTIFDVKPGDLSFTELERIIRYFTVEDNPKVTAYAVRYFSIIGETFGPLIILLIAIPFAVSGVRVNPAVGVSKSIGLFLVYFLITRLSNALGARDVLPPLWAGLAPNLTMLAVGVWLFIRRR